MLVFVLATPLIEFDEAIYKDVDGVFLGCTELWIAGSHQLWKRRLSQIRAIASKDLGEIDLCDWPTAPTIPLAAWIIFWIRIDETANF